MKRYRYLFTFLLLLGLAACQADSDEPRLVSEWEPTAVESRPLLPTKTPLPPISTQEVPTRAPTVTPVTDVVVPTLMPTPIPEGVYYRELDGFTLTYPALWEVDDSDPNLLQLTDSQLNLFIVAGSEFVDDENDYEAISEDILASEEGFFGIQSLSLLSEEEVALADGRVAQTAIFEGASIYGDSVHLYLAYVEEDARAFTLIAAGTPTNIAARQTTLDTMVAQVKLGSNQLLGYDRDETLVLLGGEPLARSLDPALQTGSAAGFVGLLYSGLVQLTPDLQVVPDLAETWEVSADGTVYTFTLREGLTFADGRPLTAVDVQYSLERAADPELESTTADTYLGDILGFRDKLNGDADTVAGIEVIDDRTIAITLDGPKPYFLAKLTYPVSFVVDEETVADKELEDWVYEPNPSGPFTLIDREENEYYVFESNEAYYAPPELQRVIYLLSRVGNAVSLFEAEEVDITGLGAVDTQEVRLPSHPLHENWVTNTSLCTTMLQLNNMLAPMDDPLVREAFALAVDKDGLNDLISDGTSLVATTILPPGMPGYSADLAAAQAERVNQIEAAQTALAQSSYGDDLPLIVLSASGFGDSERDDLNAVIETWRDVLGVDVVVEFLDPINFRDVLAEERGHIVSYGWCADYPDPENFLDILFHTDSEFNAGGYSNPEVDALLEEARVELDVATRVALYQQVEQLLLEDGATIPLSHGVYDTLVNERVEGYVLSPMGARIVPLMTLTTAGED